MDKKTYLSLKRIAANLEEVIIIDWLLFTMYITNLYKFLLIKKDLEPIRYNNALKMGQKFKALNL